MDNKGPDCEHTPKEVISVNGRKMNPGHEKDYDDWFRRYMVLERPFQRLSSLCGIG
jgi:hypothetical protein